MLKTEIRHVALMGSVENDEMAELNELVKTEALESLGYEPSDDDSHPVDRFLETLSTAGIQVLSWRDVLRYKTEERHRVEKEKMEEACLREEFRPPDDVDWNQTPIQEYKRHIPSHILQKAVTIKRLCPEVKIFVESFGVTPDPFLVARVPDPQHPQYNWYDKLYWVDVWDEPHFEERP